MQCVLMHVGLESNIRHYYSRHHVPGHFVLLVGFAGLFGLFVPFFFFWFFFNQSSLVVLLLFCLV